MNLKQLEVFLSVLEQGSFSAGARESLLTQSTVSQHIAALEAELGVRLLERSRNGVRPTEAGKIFRKHARQVLGDLRVAHEAIHRLKGAEEVTLRLAASSIPGGCLIPAVLARLCEQLPGLDITVLQGDSRETVDRVSGQEADAGVVGTKLDERGLTYAPVGHDEIRLVVPGGHPWAGRKTVPLAELAEVPLVVREPGSGTAKTVAEALARAGVDTTRFRVRARLGSNEAVKSAVLAGLGVSFLSDLSVRRDVERGDLVALDVEGLRVSRCFYLVRRTGRELPPAASAFWDLMLAAHG